MVNTRRIRNRFPAVLGLLLIILFTSSLFSQLLYAQKDKAKSRILTDASSNNFPPVNILDKDGNLKGFGRDLADEVMKAVGVELRHIHSPDWVQVLEWLDSGKADFIHDAGYTKERDVFLDYSDPILEMPEMIFVQPARYDISGLNSLKGKTVACVNKHITHLYLQTFPEIKCYIVKSPVEGLYAVIAGNADAFVYPKQIVLYLSQSLRLTDKIKTTGDPLRTLTWSMVVKKGNKEILALLNRGIAKVRESGKYERIYQKWWGKRILSGYSKQEVWVMIVAAILGTLLTTFALFLLFFNSKLRGQKRDLELQVTERRKSEKALKDNEKRFRSLFEQSNDAIFIHETGKIIDVNKKACDMLGYNRDELLSIRTVDLNVQDERSKSVARIDKVIKGESIVFESRFIKANGEIIDVEISSNYVDPGRNLIQGIARDITDRKKTEKELRQIAQQLSAHMDNSPLAVVEFDPRFRVIRWSEEAEKVFGWTAEEIVGKAISEMRWVHAEDVELVNQESEGLLTGERSRSLSINRNYRKDGSVVHCEWYNSAIYDAEGDLISILSLILNVTERKQAEQALRDSLQTSADIVASIPSGLFIYQFEEPDRLILIEGNPEAEQMTDINAQEWIGKEFNKIWPQAFDTGLAEALLKVIKTGETYETEDLRYRDTRLEGAFKIRAFPMPGRRLGVAFENITEKKKLESQLQQAQKIESIGTLAGGIAHDFNNILSPIMIHSELAMGDLPPDSPLHFNLGEILTAGERARDLVRQILTFSRMKEGKRVSIKITPIIKEALKMLRASIPTTIEIIRKLDAEKDIINGDLTQIHQVLMNLCTNAAQAMKEKGGRMEISLKEQELDDKAALEYSDLQPGSYLKLTVKDNGPGIDEETKKNIFEPYFTTKGPGEGTGLGLAVVHGIVKSYGGDIRVESNSEKGTTFDVLFPRIDEEILPKPKVATDLPIGTEKVLFVDDEISYVNAMQPMLERLGYQVISFTSSIEAIEAFRKSPDMFDLIITDMTMPGMTGNDLGREAKTIRPDIPIILCTGFNDQIDENTAKANGIDAFAMKPIDMHEIARTIRGVLDK